MQRGEMTRAEAGLLRRSLPPCPSLSSWNELKRMSSGGWEANHWLVYSFSLDLRS